ncbi:hypothetical protein AOQ84DRAFT_388569 [Glonium stellatum]|uniref:Uncharacterized protein n=1 Tax=Glonium stellatum TaxID=574774 RepID=A0A8E2JTD4_9PEZI|nr:hypothetical protein AOQ84DRAFT_388569 [Glonium stellatum]
MSFLVRHSQGDNHPCREPAPVVFAPDSEVLGAINLSDLSNPYAQNAFRLPINDNTTTSNHQRNYFYSIYLVMTSFIRRICGGIIKSTFEAGRFLADYGSVILGWWMAFLCLAYGHLTWSYAHGNVNVFWPAVAVFLIWFFVTYGYGWIRYHRLRRFGAHDRFLLFACTTAVAYVHSLAYYMKGLGFEEEIVLLPYCASFAVFTTGLWFEPPPNRMALPNISTRRTD